MAWEYKIVNIDTDRWTKTGMPTETGEMFDEWGLEGWELIKVESIFRAGLLGILPPSTCALVAFFKRPKA